MSYRNLIIFLFLVSANALAIEKIDSSSLKQAVDWIDKYSKEKNFEKATKYYTDETVFYSHQTVDGKDVVAKQTINEVLPMIEKSFESQNFQIFDDQNISENVTISSDGKTATGVYESVTIFVSGKNKFRSHGFITLVFGIRDGELVLLESHEKNISFEQL